MAEFRTDPLRGHTVLINGQRGRRPSEFSISVSTPSAATCAFCRGHEDQTPPAIEQDAGVEWTYRLFPNRYPAVCEDATTALPDNQGLAFQLANGRHEVLVESAEHFATADEYSVDHWVRILEIWQRRLRALYQVQQIRYVHIFRNQGYRGGATLVHPHQQIVALPVIPKAIALRLEKLRPDGVHEQCEHCRWIESEVRAGERLLAHGDDFVALACFAPHFPYEWQILARNHVRFDELERDRLVGLAEVLLRGLKSLRRACNGPDFNLILFSTPPDERFAAPNWAIDVLPRISTQAGFEWGTGVHIVSTPPEEAAAALRSHWA
ncbi:MAG: DUF4921 family protein [bacterium]|nr:DUF4921 family protein [bacterium]